MRNITITTAKSATYLENVGLNRPDLSNRPVRLLEPAVDDVGGLAGRICRPGVTVALIQDSFFESIRMSLGLPPGSPGALRLRTEREVLEGAGCKVSLLN